jgi:chromosome partitioning protein
MRFYAFASLRFCAYDASTTRQTQEHQAMAKVVAIENEKGGVGKTTIATNLSSCLSVKHGLKVLLLDHDPQSSSTRWTARRAQAEDGESDPGAIPVISMGKNLARDLPSLSSRYDVVIIDGLPQTDVLTAAAIKVADLVIVPVQPSAYDLWACEATLNVIRERQEISGGQPKGSLLVSRAIPNTLLERGIREQLDATGFYVFAGQTVHRQAYAQGVAQGLSVMDLPPTDKARIEIEAITLEVLELLK